jgi:hypothetical protein
MKEIGSCSSLPLSVEIYRALTLFIQRDNSIKKQEKPASFHGSKLSSSFRKSLRSPPKKKPPDKD